MNEEKSISSEKLTSLWEDLQIPKSLLSLPHSWPLNGQHSLWERLFRLKGEGWNLCFDYPARIETLSGGHPAKGESEG